MKITLYTANGNNQHFGMSLLMKSQKENARKIGEYPSAQLEFARPSLETLAEDVDIKVSTIKNNEPKLRGVKVTITKSISSQLKRFFYMGKRQSTSILLREVGTTANFPDYVLRQTRNLKSGFMRYI